MLRLGTDKVRKDSRPLSKFFDFDETEILVLQPGRYDRTMRQANSSQDDPHSRPATRGLFPRAVATLRVNRWPWLVSVLILIFTTIQLRLQGRRWWCACGRPFLWSGNVHSRHNSQHLADPYSFSHVEHGILFYGLFTWLCPRLSVAWRLVLTLALEVSWEIVENTRYVINRYREATIAFDYLGDTITNSLGDILSCVLGFYLARRIGFWGSLAVIIVTEIAMLFWIRDNLLLNIVMLLHPFQSVKQWQAAF
jgi:hypothetical protein